MRIEAEGGGKNTNSKLSTVQSVWHCCRWLGLRLLSSLGQDDETKQLVGKSTCGFVAGAWRGPDR